MWLKYLVILEFFMTPLAVFKGSYAKVADLPQDDKAQIALIGRSNVGKSSLINQLTGLKNLAFVSSAPGRTQTINLFAMRHGYYLVDFEPIRGGSVFLSAHTILGIVAN